MRDRGSPFATAHHHHPDTRVAQPSGHTHIPRAQTRSAVVSRPQHRTVKMNPPHGVGRGPGHVQEGRKLVRATDVLVHVKLGRCEVDDLHLTCTRTGLGAGAACLCLRAPKPRAPRRV